MTESRRQATKKYKQKNIKRIALEMNIEDYYNLLKHIDGTPVNTYIKALINKDMNR